MDHKLFVGPHVPTDEMRSKVAHDRAEALAVLKDHAVHDAQIGEYLASIDHAVASDILNREFRRGVPPVMRGEIEAPVIPQDQIVCTNDAGFTAVNTSLFSDLAIWPATGLILVNIPALRQSIAGLKNISARTYVLKAYFHEQCHAISAYSEVERDGMTTMRSGLASARGKGDTYLGEEHYYLNEIINEKKARSLTVKYLRRMYPGEAWAQADIRALEDDYQTEGSMTFVFGPHMLRVIVKKIAEYGEPFSEKAVWQALWHSELHGLLLGDTGVKKALDLDRIFGDGFTKRLTHFKKEDALKFLAEHGVVDSDARLRDQIAREYGLVVQPRQKKR
jgi:hypothetical protein